MADSDDTKKTDGQTPPEGDEDEAASASDETSTEESSEETAEESSEVSEDAETEGAEESADAAGDEDSEPGSEADDAAASDEEVETAGSDDEEEASEDDEVEASGDDEEDASEDEDAAADQPVLGGGDDGDDGDHGDDETPPVEDIAPSDEPVEGIAAFFDHPDSLMSAARKTRDSDYEEFDAFSPFPIHGMDEAMGLGRSWIPWVTFFAGLTGFILANAMQFGMMTFDWPLIIGGKPFAPWPSFVPIMFELTVLIGGVTTAIVALVAGGCFQKPFIIDSEITNDRFALWISADDADFDREGVVDFMESLQPVEIRTITESDDESS